MWDVVITSAVAVGGTLAGSYFTARQQARLQASARREQRVEDRRRQAITDVAELQAALAAHRRAMTVLRHARLTDAGPERIELLITESHTTRDRITARQVRVKLAFPELADQVDAAVAAVYSIDQSVRTSTPELAELELERQAAREASDLVTVAAAQLLGSVTGQ
jgi:hypothetical protein